MDLLKDSSRHRLQYVLSNVLYLPTLCTLPQILHKRVPTYHTVWAGLTQLITATSSKTFGEKTACKGNLAAASNVACNGYGLTGILSGDFTRSLECNEKDSTSNAIFKELM